ASPTGRSLTRGAVATCKGLLGDAVDPDPRKFGLHVDGRKLHFTFVVSGRTIRLLPFVRPSDLGGRTCVQVEVWREPSWSWRPPYWPCHRPARTRAARSRSIPIASSRYIGLRRLGSRQPAEKVKSRAFKHVRRSRIALIARSTRAHTKWPTPRTAAAR